MNKLPDGVVNIRGKQYQTVALRVHTFREQFPKFALTTDVLHRDADCVVMRATISDEAGRVVATGHAEEYRKASEINKTSALENAETSAIGRALAALGIGGTEFASADEVARAVSGQKGEPPALSGPALIFAELDPDTQRRLRMMAPRIIGHMPNAAAALAELDAADLSNDEKAGLWSLLDSTTRSALKRAHEAATAPKDAA